MMSKICKQSTLFLLTGRRSYFRLGENEEDRSVAGKAATSDNVALMALLQPWEDSDHPSGACVVCTQLCEEEGYHGDAVRSLQARGLTRTIEAFNSDFALPIVMCGTMNCVPSSGTYEILCRGVEAQDPARPGPPGKPLVEPISTSAARLRWAPPQDDSESLSPAIETYRLLWTPGGSRFLPGESLDVHEADCVVYDLIKTDSGNVKSQQNPLRSFVAAGLSSGVAYEFRVLAINALGQGPWSERSEPVRMPCVPGNEPEDRVLLGAASIKLLRKRELEEARRRAEAKLADPRAYELRKLVKVDGLLDLGRENVHPFDSVSGMTPRYSDAVLHPDLANVRTDTGFPTIKEAMNVSGARSERQKHALGLRSAYMSHSSGGEPTFTVLSDNTAGTVDYIFFSADCLLPVEVLSLPEMGSLVGRDIRQTEVVPIIDRDESGVWAPTEWQGDCEKEGYMGEWSPYLRENPQRLKHRIPNEVFPSDHLMLMANLVYFEPRCPSTWR